MKIVILGNQTIRNNTALKHNTKRYYAKSSFGTIRNNTALKPTMMSRHWRTRLGTIRNNTAKLK